MKKLLIKVFFMILICACGFGITTVFSHLKDKEVVDYVWLAIGFDNG